MKKSELKSGMRIQHTQSGRVGLIRGDGRGHLLRAHKDYVQVSYLLTGHWRKGSLRHTTWALANIRLPPHNIEHTKER